MKISDYLSEGGLQGLVDKELQKQRDERNEKIAVGVARNFLTQVEHLRELRAAEKRQKLRVKKLGQAIEDFEKSGDEDILRGVGLL